MNFRNRAFILMAILVLGAGCVNSANQTNKTKNNTAMKTINLTKADFLTKVADYQNSPNDWKYLGDKPAIIDFYATWCGPCKALSPVLEELAEEYAGKIYIYKVDTDKEEELSSVFSIRSVPSLLFIPMEGQPQMGQGVVPKQDLKEAIERILLNNKK